MMAEITEPQTENHGDNIPEGHGGIDIGLLVLFHGYNRCNKIDFNCKHCHGITGQSDAPMVLKEKYPPPPKFTERLPEISEGQMFHSIYYGKNQMPGNKDDLTEEEIWWLVSYIQTFAKQDEKSN